MYKLKPNQKLILQNHSGIAVVHDSLQHNRQEATLRTATNPELPLVTITGLQIDKADSSSYEAAWVNNTLAFSNESFADIALKMENWYGVEIEFANSRLEAIRFTGKFTSESVTDALQALQFTARFSFKKNQQKILIY
jgi:ferric-dicitrate binding protein FerR (iron transport regulator)